MTAFTDKSAKAACHAARMGHTAPACAARAGVHHRTLYRWLHENEEFRVAFSLAKLEGRAALEGHALAGAPEDPKHALELLSRRHPEAWGKTDRVKVDAKVEHSVTLSSLPAAEKARLLRLALAEAERAAEDGDE